MENVKDLYLKELKKIIAENVINFIQKMFYLIFNMFKIVKARIIYIKIIFKNYFDYKYNNLFKFNFLS